jgi:hypothetical protein
LEEKNDLICDLEEEIVKNKVFFANSILKMNQSAVSSPTCVSGQTYASVTRSSLPGAVPVAKCVDGGSSAVLDVHSVKKLLDTPNSGLIPSHVRYKNHRVYVTLDNEADVAKAAAILNSKPDFQSNFDPASKLNVLFPVIDLFVNVSDPASLKVELEHRNKSLRCLIHSVKVVFTKQHTTEGHVKLFLRTKQARDDILFLGKASILGIRTIASSPWISIEKSGAATSVNNTVTHNIYVLNRWPVANALAPSHTRMHCCF